MPSRNGIGQSEATRVKQFALDKRVGHLLATSAMVARNYRAPFVVCDMTAGPGYYAELALDGSPLVLARHIVDWRNRGIVARFICCERNKQTRLVLQARMRERYPDLHVDYFGDQTEALASVPRDAVGLTYWDPTHYSRPRDGLNQQLLARFGRSHRRMDILFTRACLSGRRVLSADHCKDSALAIDGYLRITGKKCLYILPYHPHDWWAFGFASNWQQRPARKFAMFALDSAEATAFLVKIHEGVKAARQHTQPEVQERDLWTA